MDDFLAGIEAQRDMIVASMGVPAEFLEGGRNYRSAETSLEAVKSNVMEGGQQFLGFLGKCLAAEAKLRVERVESRALVLAQRGYESLLPEKRNISMGDIRVIAYGCGPEWFFWREFLLAFYEKAKKEFLDSIIREYEERVWQAERDT